MEDKDKALAEEIIVALQKVVSDADTAGYPEISHLASVALLAAEEAAEREIISRRTSPAQALDAITAAARLTRAAETYPAI
tara:strand:+ start:1119 stop:1361 length:243 start_codon:yes stop_codon:yes gene_type:complete